MPHYFFRKLRLSDISKVVDIDARAMTLTTYGDGTISLDTPDLTPPQLYQLRELVKGHGYIEDDESNPDDR